MLPFFILTFQYYVCPLKYSSLSPELKEMCIRTIKNEVYFLFLLSKHIDKPSILLSFTYIS